MKKALITMMCLAAMFAAGTCLKAQEITIVLAPGYNWISYPNAEAMPIVEALGSFTPSNGDIIQSQFDSYCCYLDGSWRGDLTQFVPGLGYKYYSARSEEVEFVFAQPASNVVTTDEPTDITLTSAVVGGTVTLPEGSQVFLRGVCWGTEPRPDIDGDHTTEETGIGSFSNTLEDLNANTTYYVRAYVVYDHGLAYGNELSFTTLSGIPVVTTAEVTDVTATTATCGGTVTDDGGLDITARGVCWSTSHNPTLSNNHTSDGTGTGSFGSSLITLSPNTTYYVRAYATTAHATSYGEEMTFTTLSGIPTVSTADVTDITATTATCGGTVTDGGGLDITARGVCWSTSHNPTIVDAHSTDGTGTGNFSSTLTGLTPNTTYFVRAYATNSYVTVYGNLRSFTTAPLPNCTVSVTCNPTEGGTITGGGTYEQGQSCTLTATANEGYTFTNWTENDEVVSTDATYSFTVETDRALVANFAVSSGGDHDYVDLGLPSGLLWATCNVGADAPEDYGDYFAWGETQPKDTYNWSNYQYCNGSSSTLTKYCNKSNYGYNGFTDNLTTLLPEDDAATANWGSDWRMPTQAEWQELYQNTTHTWTTQNGVNGRLFTAPNGNSLFLPAAGYRDYSSLDGAGSDGGFWSSSLYTDLPDNAWGFYFFSGNFSVSGSDRYYGLSVRGVRSAYQNNSFSIDATASPSEGGIVAGAGNYSEGSTCTLIATANEDYTFTNWTENGSQVSTNATYTFTVNADRTLVANFIQGGSGGDHAYVDLGLPSGLLWATCNVGADNPEDYGDYFAWGETQPKDYYNWSTYQYCNGNYNMLTKYCNNEYYGYNGFTDDLTTLLPEDDAATANWGSDWRMPTKEEWQELYNNTTHTWTTQNGVNGRLFTAPNGNSLFLPAAGYRFNSSLYNAGIYVYHWSSSLNTDFPEYAWFFNYYSDNFCMTNYYRYYGQSVRGVRSSRQN